MSKKFKKIPKFNTEDEDAEFWNTHDSTDYIDWSKAVNVIFPNLKRTPPSKLIPARVPSVVKKVVKERASKKT